MPIISRPLKDDCSIFNLEFNSIFYLLLEDDKKLIWINSILNLMTVSRRIYTTRLLDYKNSNKIIKMNILC